MELFAFGALIADILIILLALAFLTESFMGELSLGAMLLFVLCLIGVFILIFLIFIGIAELKSWLNNEK